MAKAYSEQQKADFVDSFAKSGQSLKDWCAGEDLSPDSSSDTAVKRPSLHKMNEWFDERKGITKDKRTRKQLLDRIKELEIKLATTEKFALKMAA